MLYKSHVLSFIEYRTPAVSHASTSALFPVDAVQRRYLQALGVSDVDALLHFYLAPLAVRRNIAILGVLHRAAIGISPSLSLASSRCFLLLLLPFVPPAPSAGILVSSGIPATCVLPTMFCGLRLEQSVFTNSLGGHEKHRAACMGLAQL